AILTVGLVAFVINIIAHQIYAYFTRRVGDPEHAQQRPSGLAHSEPARHNSSWYRAIEGAVVPVLVIVIWQITAMVWAPYILPTPTSIIQTFFNHFSELLSHTAVTLGQLIGGVVLSLPAALLLAWIMENRPVIGAFLLPLGRAFAATPG